MSGEGKRARLTRAQRDEIRGLRPFCTASAVAVMFGISERSVLSIWEPEAARQAARRREYQRAKARDPEAIHRRNVEAGRRYRARMKAAPMAASDIGQEGE